MPSSTAPDAAAALKGASLAFQRTGTPSNDARSARHDDVPRIHAPTNPKSPSFIAATLAASRSASPSPQGRLSLNHDAVDSESIAPTGSLISLFEGSRAAASIYKPKPPAPEPVALPRREGVYSQQPRSTDRISAMPMPKPKPPALTAMRPSYPDKPNTPSPPSVVASASTELLSPKPVRVVQPLLDEVPTLSSQPASSPSPDPEKKSPQTQRLRPPTPPKPRGHRLAASQSVSRNRRRGTSDTSTPLSSSSSPMEYGLPAVPPPKPQRVKTPPPRLPRRRESVASAPTSPVLRPARQPTNMTLNHLSGAIMAGSLASSRLTPHNTGSSLPPPSLPPRQKSPRLLQTLRQPAAEDDDDRRKLHRHRLTNKHAHHEGSRKRWRDEITAPQRKRYEAVWASNRGYLLPEDDPSVSVASGINRINSECVANVAVRDIWLRSRLPEDELGAVWDLVDRGDAGKLTRQEFVVGMWLLDQLLRGRKLPAKVSDSVWASANGIRVLKPKR